MQGMMTQAAKSEGKQAISRGSIGAVAAARVRALPVVGVTLDSKTTRALATKDLHAVEALPGSEADHAMLSPQQEQLLVEHLSVVRYVARAIHDRLPQHVELDELVSAGTLGLVDAARKFNPGRNVQFRSYAQFRVRGAILDSLRSLDWGPRELRRKGRAMEEARSRLKLRLGRAPQENEVAEELGMTLLEVQQLAGQLKGLEVGSLQAERGEDSGEDDLAFLPANENENPLTQFLEKEKHSNLVAAIEALPERERQVLQLYYFEELNMREIGQVLGVVESRVSQIHHMAVKRLRGDMARMQGRGQRNGLRHAG